jgi:hypothetical protein
VSLVLARCDFSGSCIAGKLGSYYTGAYKLYHLRVGANDTDKNALDLVLRFPLNLSHASVFPLLCMQKEWIPNDTRIQMHRFMCVDAGVHAAKCAHETLIKRNSLLAKCES